MEKLRPLSAGICVLLKLVDTLYLGYCPSKLGLKTLNGGWTQGEAGFCRLSVPDHFHLHCDQEREKRTLLSGVDLGWQSALNFGGISRS